MQEITLTKGKVALVDDADFETLRTRNWQAHFYKGRWYARRNSTAQERRAGAALHIWLHHEILSVPRGMRIDHRNGDGLNCQRHNLRAATHQQNGHNRRLGRDNSSGFKGVSWHKGNKRWIAGIRLNNRRLHLGNFTDPVTAAKAYDAKAIELHGEFARLNFPSR